MRSSARASPRCRRRRRGESRLRELPLDLIAVNRRQPRRVVLGRRARRSSPRRSGRSAWYSRWSCGRCSRRRRQRPLLGIRRRGRGGSAAADPAGVAGTPGSSREPAPAPHFELIAGERRLRAARLAGLDHIPALVRPADEVASLEIALAENVAREDLNSIEEAQAYAALVDEFGLTHAAHRRAGRAQPRRGDQPAAPARAARRRAAHDRAGRAERRATGARCSGCPTTGSAARSRAWS